MTEPTYFETPAKLRAWFRKHHAKAEELLLGYWKVDSGQPSVTWPQSVDEALCVGWIDGVRRRIDADRYTIRFTPRRPGSVWSRVNVKRVAELVAEGRMQPAGLAVFEARGEQHQHGYTFADRAQDFPPEIEARFRIEARGEQHQHGYTFADRAQDFPPEIEARFRSASADGWAFFASQPPGYRRACIHWVTSPKLEATRLKRLTTLVGESAAGRRLA